MSVAHRANLPSRVHVPQARLEVAWTASARALGVDRGYSTVALRLEAEWDPADRSGSCSMRASLDRSGAVAEVLLPVKAEVRVVRRGPWTHVEVLAPGARDGLLTASFRDGRLAYCIASAPAAAGLPGGSYDAPTGILELYDSP
jgi:hypothetical protein